MIVPPHVALWPVASTFMTVAAVKRTGADMHVGVIRSWLGPGASLGVPAQQSIRHFPNEFGAPTRDTNLVKHASAQ